MKKTYETINYEWLVRPTGDAFADTGGYVIRYLSEKYPDKDILELIEYVMKVYINKWNAKINAFFLNSKITQPAFKNEQKATETIRYYSDLIGDKEPHIKGHCRMSGEYTSLFRAGRDNSIMSGSWTFGNFHHNFQSGIMLSKEMIIRMFFVPFGTLSVGGKIAIVQSSYNEINYYFIKKICEINMVNIASSSCSEVLRSEYGIPVNALFSFINDLLSNELPEIETWLSHELSFTLYHFTNFGASPEIKLYSLPANVFKFYLNCNAPGLREDWKRFLFAHYRSSKYKGAEYDAGGNTYNLINKNKTEIIPFNEYKLWRNPVLENLLNNKSLMPIFLKWGEEHELKLAIIEIYQIIIRNMRQETINKIKELSLFLTSGDDDAIRKNIKKLNGCKNSYEVRRFLLKSVAVPNYDSGAEDPILTLEDVVYYLFPDDQPWRDIRDLLLFAIYQELHKLKKAIPADILQEDDD